MSRGARFRGSYTALAVIWTNFCVALLLANWAASFFIDEDSEGVFGNWVDDPPQFIVEAFEINYPDWSPAERTRLWRESAIRFRPDPLVQYREEAVSGRYVNVEEAGYRLGRNQGVWPPDRSNFNVFLLGGSTGFGYGVPDDQTISSHLQEILTSVRGRKVFVYNLARGGFNSTMERVLFEKIITVGPIPDLAIFLDGVNDMSYPTEPPIVNSGLTHRAERAERSPWISALEKLALVKAVLGDARDLGAAEVEKTVPTGPNGKMDQDAMVRLAVERYVKNKAAIEAVGATRDVQTFFIWQPAPTYRYDLSYHTYKRKSFGGHDRSGIGFPLMRTYVDTHDMGKNFHWCADIQQGVKQLLYVDRMHYSAGMSERVARCIADGLVRSGLLK